jgi:hypothetical protein
VQKYHLVVEGDSDRRSIDFQAETPDYALNIAEREADGTRAELWQGETLLARMTKAAPNLWKLHRCRDVGGAGRCEGGPR